ncbi:hypothetical protein ACFSYH_06675 [Populibacterium corticicola]|uniref:Acid-shock protein n=1 Tax=Populibacterium corticicola TaxID=1812826 RepID=A0ABW5XF40_9MICO
MAKFKRTFSAALVSSALVAGSAAFAPAAIAHPDTNDSSTSVVVLGPATVYESPNAPLKRLDTPKKSKAKKSTAKKKSSSKKTTSSKKKSVSVQKKTVKKTTVARHIHAV